VLTACPRSATNANGWSTSEDHLEYKVKHDWNEEHNGAAQIVLMVMFVAPVVSHHGNEIAEAE
jgi:hypothetical protein